MQISEADHRRRRSPPPRWRRAPASPSPRPIPTPRCRRAARRRRPGRDARRPRLRRARRRRTSPPWPRPWACGGEAERRDGAGAPEAARPAAGRHGRRARQGARPVREQGQGGARGQPARRRAAGRRPAAPRRAAAGPRPTPPTAARRPAAATRSRADGAQPRPEPHVTASRRIEFDVAAGLGRGSARRAAAAGEFASWRRYSTRRRNSRPPTRPRANRPSSTTHSAPRRPRPRSIRPRWSTSSARPAAPSSPTRGAARRVPDLHRPAPVRPAGGQQWTTLDELAAGRTAIHPAEGELLGIGTTPHVRHRPARAARPVRRLNLLWDCITLLDDATAAEVERRGGLAAHRDLPPALLLGHGRVGAALRLPDPPARRRRRVGHAARPGDRVLGRRDARARPRPDADPRRRALPRRHGPAPRARAAARC